MHRSYPRYDIFSRKVILPSNAPQEYFDEQIFVSALDRAEKRRDAQTAKELIFSLPVELSLVEQKELAYRCIEEFWGSRGVCAYVCIHDSKSKTTGSDNPHVHALLSTRPIDENGFAAKKNREWNKKELLLEWREFWADIQNRALEKIGCETRVSHESYKVQKGIKKTPTKYLGAKTSALERDGFTTEQGDENRAIMADRKKKPEFKKSRKKRRQRGRSY